jgi:hypothetical protein
VPPTRAAVNRNAPSQAERLGEVHLHVVGGLYQSSRSRATRVGAPHLRREAATKHLIGTARSGALERHRPSRHGRDRLGFFRPSPASLRRSPRLLLEFGDLDPDASLRVIRRTSRDDDLLQSGRQLSEQNRLVNCAGWVRRIIVLKRTELSLELSESDGGRGRRFSGLVFHLSRDARHGMRTHAARQDRSHGASEVSRSMSSHGSADHPSLQASLELADNSRNALKTGKPSADMSEGT